MALLVREVNAAGYRSLRAIRFPVARLTVVVGANGVGKTNLYRALQLLQAAASGTLAREIAGEGGMAAAMWAGARRDKGPPRIALSVAFAADGDDPSDAAGPAYSYEVAIGFRTPTGAAFAEEPQVKEETLTFHAPRRRMKMLERRGPSVTARDRADQLVEVDTDLMASETALGSLEDPARFPTSTSSVAPCSTGASIMGCAPIPTRRCGGRAWRWRRRPWPRTAPTSPRCSRRSPISARTRRRSTGRSRTPSRAPG